MLNFPLPRWWQLAASTNKELTMSKHLSRDAEEQPTIKECRCATSREFNRIESLRKETSCRFFLFLFSLWTVQSIFLLSNLSQTKAQDNKKNYSGQTFGTISDHVIIWKLSGLDRSLKTLRLCSLGSAGEDSKCRSHFLKLKSPANFFKWTRQFLYDDKIRVSVFSRGDRTTIDNI